MKIHILLFYILIMISSQNTQDHTEDSSSFTFPVFDVEQNKKLPSQFWTAQDAFLKRIHPNAKIEDFSHKNSRLMEDKLLVSDMNGVMSAIHWSYTQHYPLKLSVSDFILMIGQGLAKHMEANAEELRAQFVDFKGKEKLVVERADLYPGKKNNDWSTVFGQFTEMIRERVKTDLYDVIVDDTSVATKLTRISSEIALMDAFKQYFEYEVRFICGIPKLTLVGKKEDWEKLRAKVHKLAELNEGNKLLLDWWLEKLVPLVDTIVEQAGSRNIDKEFWKNIYKWQIPEKGYDPKPTITGWINVFNPYLRSKKGDIFKSNFGEVNPEYLTSGFSRIPFIWNVGEKIPMNFFGGFLAAKMGKGNLIEPVHFFAVTYDDGSEKTSPKKSPTTVKK